MQITFERFKEKFAEEIDEFVDERAETDFALDDETEEKISGIFTKELIAELLYEDADIIFTAAQWGASDTPVRDA